ncbi:MAG: hypothetical protein SO188_14455 [Prevotella sp.]|nr:hypothetical protein [Prevotella sp.]
MKKQTNISVLKELVNNNVMERVELRTRGVQAYNIAEGEEYNVIVAYAKQGGRYYFIDRDGRRFLASRYDRAEFVAGEMLEVIANDRAAAVQAADQLERSGSVLVCADLLALFFEECDRRGIKATSTAAGVDNLGRMLTRYDLVKDDEPAQPEDNDAQSAEGNQAPAEPSRIAQAAAKVSANVEAYAAKAAQRVAFLVSLLAALALALGVIFGTVWIIGTVCDALSISAAARFVVSLFALFGPALELAINIECNFLAVIARLFPGYFSYPIPFEVFSFWGRMLRA